MNPPFAGRGEASDRREGRSGGTSIPVLHTIELLDFAHGGPKPDGLESAKGSPKDRAPLAFAGNKFEREGTLAASAKTIIWGIFEVRIGELETLVTIDLGRVMDSDETKFRVSHAIKTPTQIGPYRTSIPVADYPAYALHKAITGLTDYYRDAVKKRHKPSEQWLVKN